MFLFLVSRVLRFSVHGSGLFSCLLLLGNRLGVDFNPEPLNLEPLSSSWFLKFGLNILKYDMATRVYGN
jgi:hypothetical protein